MSPVRPIRTKSAAPNPRTPDRVAPTAPRAAPREADGLSAGRAALLALLIFCGGYLLVLARPVSTEGEMTVVSSAAAYQDAIKGYTALSFANLSAFDYTPGMPVSALPVDVRSADGRKVSIHGFMLPLEVTARGVTQFLLNDSFDMCQFGLGSGAPNQWVEVVMSDGRRVPYTHRPITVVGTFSLGERRRNGRVLTLYRLAAERVISSE